MFSVSSNSVGRTEWWPCLQDFPFALPAWLSPPAGAPFPSTASEVAESASGFYLLCLVKGIMSLCSTFVVQKKKKHKKSFSPIFFNKASKIVPPSSPHSQALVLGTLWNHQQYRILGVAGILRLSSPQWPNLWNGGMLLQDYCYNSFSTNIFLKSQVKMAYTKFCTL